MKFLLDVWRVQASEGDAPYFCISTKSRGGKWKEHFFEWPIDQDELTNFFSRYSTDDYNLYFCPHGFTEPKRKKEFAGATSFLWADLDGMEPQRCNPKPQIAWQSSPGRYAALWRLNDHHPRESVEEVNRALSYANGADHGGWDFTQVLRIPGTRNHKYKNSPKGKLLWTRDNRLPLDHFPDEVVEEVQTTLKQLVADKRMKADTRRLLLARHAVIGARSETIWKLENDLHEQGFSSGEIFRLIKSSVWNKFKGRRNEDGQLRRELEKVKAKKPTGKKKGNFVDDAEEVEEEKLERPGLTAIRLADVEPETVEWLWWPYIPLGKLTIIEGDPGLGKSWLTMALTTFVSAKQRLPGQEVKVGGNVLVLSAEDGLGDTIRPRLDTLGADSSKVYAIAESVTFDEDGTEDLDQLMTDLAPKLVICDPLVAYMGGQVDLHKANETRAVMARLARLAEKHHCAVVGIRHLTKGSRDKSIYRGIGSIDITAAARSVMLVGRNPDDPDEGRVLCHIKCNLAPLGRAQAYRLDKNNPKPFRFEGPVDFTAEDVFKAEATAGNSGGDDEWARACEWLRDALEDGPRPSDEVKQEGEARGFGKKMMKRLRTDLSIKVGMKEGRVTWSLS